MNSRAVCVADAPGAMAPNLGLCRAEGFAVRRRQSASACRETGGSWWSQTESNRRPLACHASALPTELWPHCPWTGNDRGRPSRFGSALLIARPAPDQAGKRKRCDCPETTRSVGSSACSTRRKWALQANHAASVEIVSGDRMASTASFVCASRKAARTRS